MSSGGGWLPGGRSATELFFEAGLIVFAVLVALGVQEAWDDREERQRGQEALAAIRSEFAANLEELTENEPENDSAFGSVAEALDTDDARRVRGLTYNYSLQQSDVWESARLTGAMRTVDLRLQARISQLYGVQATFSERQDRLLEGFTEYIGAVGTERESTALRTLFAQWAVTRQIGCYLASGYEIAVDHFQDEALDDERLTELLEAGAAECDAAG